MASKKGQDHKLVSAFVFRFWSDARFRSRARKDVAAAMEEVGIQPLPGVNYQLVEQTWTDRFIVVPAKPRAKRAEKSTSTQDLKKAARSAIQFADATGIETTVAPIVGLLGGGSPANKAKKRR